MSPSAVTATPPIIVDQYAPLSHKEIVGRAGHTIHRAGILPSWVPPEDRRRLNAYLVRASYTANVARYLLPDGTNDKQMRGHREYGDIDLLVQRVRAAVLGDEWSIVADGADDDLLAGPDLPDRPEAPTGDDPIARRIYDVAIAAWNDHAEQAFDEWAARVEAQPLARERQRQAREWAESHQLAARLLEAETDAVSLGDGVLVLWPQAGDWPLVTAHDPGFYFPELDDDAANEFPATVHLAWAFDHHGPDGTEVRVRRMTWELRSLASLRVGEDGEWTALGDGESFDEDGQVGRSMPWHGDGDDPSTVACWFVDAVWRQADLLGRNERHPEVDPFSEEPVEWINTGEDLRIDFIPVVHLPNTPTGQAHFGRSIIDNVAQVADDVAQVDNLTMSAASYIGDPTIGVSGVKVGENAAVMPGRVFELGEKGRMDVLDLSGGVDKLGALAERLQDRLWQNGGVPREVIGRALDANMSGVALALRLAPFAQLIAAMRIGRENKDRLVPRFAVKMAMASEAIEGGPVGELRIVRGGFLPTDKQQTVEMVSAALGARAISTTTAVGLLVSAGVAIDDAAAEVARIRSEDAETAEQIAAATGSEQLAAEWLGVELPETDEVPPPSINLP